jgi:methylamine--corrinoid protein Co-methyltransferase
LEKENIGKLIVISILEFEQRAQSGPVMKTDEFDIAFSMKIRELVKKYNIEFKPDELIVDDETADAVFNAGVELLADIGLYHLNTFRVIKYSKEEIFEIANQRKQNPGKVILGLGDDEMTIEYRQSTDKRKPTLYVGVGGEIFEDEFVPLVTTFARDRRIKGLGICGGISKVGDIEPRAGRPSEIYCALWEQERIEEVLKSVGRPGMSVGLLCTASTVGATMHVMANSFRGAHNTHIGAHIIPEQKVDWDRFLLANYCHSKGITPWQSSMSLMGALCRDAADTAVCLVANMLGQMSYCHGPMCSVFPTNIEGKWATRPVIWAASAAMRASERNIRLAVGSGALGSYQWMGLRPGVLQGAVTALAYTGSGFAYTWLSGSPLEAVLIDEIMGIAANMDREELKQLTETVMKRVEIAVEEEQPRESMLHFKDIYDINTLEPLPKYETLFYRAKEELFDLGVPLSC